MKRLWLALAAIGCSHELTPEEQRSADEWVDSYVKISVRAREEAAGSEPQFKAMRDREAIEMQIMGTLERTGWPRGFQISITSRGEALDRREAELARGSSADTADERRRLGLMKEALAHLAAKVLPKLPENQPKPKIPKPTQY